MMNTIDNNLPYTFDLYFDFKYESDIAAAFNNKISWWDNSNNYSLIRMLKRYNLEHLIPENLKYEYDNLENIAQKSYDRYLKCKHPLMVEQILDTVNTDKQLKCLDHWKDVFRDIPEIYEELLKL